MLISFYTGLFYPNNFEWEDIEELARVLDSILEEVFNFKLLDIEHNEEKLELKITEESFRNFINITNYYNRHPMPETTSWGIVHLPDESEFFEGLLEFMEGDIDFEFVLNFDKRVGILNKSILYLDYLDTGISREIGFQFLAGKRVHINREISIYKDYYPSYPSSDWLNMEDWDKLEKKIEEATLYYYLGIGFSIVVAVSLIEGIIYWRSKRKDKKGLLEKLPKTFGKNK
jgi:hypothetical protein